jgi:archaellum component FlaC
LPPRRKPANEKPASSRNAARPSRRRTPADDGGPAGSATPATGTAKGGTNRPLTWLVLVYRVPTEPTRLRAAVWRRLRNLGAIYLQNSVAALPADAKAERALRALRNEIIEGMGGRAQLLSSTALVGESDLVAEFNAARDDEYEEILDKCRDFHAEIDKETTVEHFTYGELEEIEADLEKLQRWYEKVKERDTFRSSRSDEVREALEKCAADLQTYASLVYQAESDYHNHNGRKPS